MSNYRCTQLMASTVHPSVIDLLINTSRQSFHSKTPMNSIEIDDIGAASLPAKPCTICRRRKVKCDKLRPCSNCVRAKQVCTYDTSDSRGDHPGPEGSSSQSGDNDLRERLARLEELMATMMMTGHATSRGSPEVANQPLNRSSQASKSPTPSRLPSQSHTAPFQAPETDIPTGQIVFQEGYSGYFDPDFWPGLIAEVPRV